MTAEIIQSFQKERKPMLIVGCGYIGQLLGAVLIRDGHSVTGVVSSETGATRSIEAGVPALVIDLDRDLSHLPLENMAEVFYLTPPPGQGAEDPRLGRFLDFLEQRNLTPRLVYMGTTGVYGDCGGDWVDETRPLNPQTDRARRRADAEARLTAWSQRTGAEVIRLRVAGIYGPGRLPEAFLKSGAPVLNAAEAPFSNRIQAHDLVSICVAAMAKAPGGEVFNVADGNPSSMTDYFFKAADFLHLPRPTEVDRRTAEKTMSPGMLSYLQENRRIDNGRLLKVLDLKLAYAELESGLSACKPEGTA